MKDWFRRKKQEEDLAAELRSHMAIEERERMQAGDSPEAAAEAARRVFGNTTRIHEEVRETWGWASLERLFEDVRFGGRMLRKTPLWTLMICSTLALGIGMSTAIFSVVYGVLWQPLPYPDAERIVTLWPTSPMSPNSRYNVSGALWLEWRKSCTLIENIALTRPVANFNLTGEGAPERLQGARTSDNVPIVLGIQPLLGRIFNEEEVKSDAKVALLSHRLWQRRFGGEPGIVGRKIQLNGEPFEVIGVMPAGYQYPTADFELWTPLFLPAWDFKHGANHSYHAIGRLKAGRSVAEAQAELTAIVHRLAAEYPAYRNGANQAGGLVQTLVESESFQVRDTLRALLAATGCLLLIGCLNLAILLIARTTARSREHALRAALGASASRLRMQVIAEVLPLCVAGATGGLLLAWAMLKALLPLLPAGTPRAASIGLHAPAMTFAVFASVAVIVLASLLPARLVGRGAAAGSRSVTAGGRTRDLLVVAQIALALVLVCGGILFGRSLGALLRVDPGFEPEATLSMHLAVTRARYSSDAQVAEYYRKLTSAIEQVPGVTAVGLVNRLPLSGLTQTGGVEFEGRAVVQDADWRSATPGYFPAIGIPLKQGRLFAESDRLESAPVTIVDEWIAKRVFGDENPVGKRMRRYLPGEQQQDPWSEIVGVAGHVKNDSLERDFRPQVYWPETQRTQDRAALVVRVNGKPESFTPAILDRIRQVNPEQPLYEIRPMNQWVERTMQSRKLTTGLIGIFSGASLLLACLGLYGVVSYAAERRTREFGIRVALGAGAGEIRGLVLRHAGKLSLAGVAAGFAISLPVARSLESLLYGVTGWDAVSWVLAPSILIAVALLAGLGPAYRASQADPAMTLRSE